MPPAFGLRLGEQQVRVFGHHYVTKDAERIGSAGLLQRLLEHRPRLTGRQLGLAVVATEGHEMELLALLEPV